MKNDNRVKYSLRIDKETLDRFGMIAESNHRSINSELIVLIEEFLKSRESTSSEKEPQEHSK